MNVRIFGVRARECMCAQTRPRFILSSERVWGEMESEPMLTPREKSPLLETFSLEEYRTHDAASSRTASPTHYQRAIPAPRGGRNPRRCIKQDSEPNTLPTSYSGPQRRKEPTTWLFLILFFISISIILMTITPRITQIRSHCL